MIKRELSNNDIFDKVVKISGIYEKVFGKKLLNYLIFNKEYERSKRILKEVYAFSDVDDIFGASVNSTEFKNISKIIFRFYDSNNNDSKK